jgi:hypothetical protein
MFSEDRQRSSTGLNCQRITPEIQYFHAWFQGHGVENCVGPQIAYLRATRGVDAVIPEFGCLYTKKILEIHQEWQYSEDILLDIPHLCCCFTGSGRKKSAGTGPSNKRRSSTTSVAEKGFEPDPQRNIRTYSTCINDKVA